MIRALLTALVLGSALIGFNVLLSWLAIISVNSSGRLWRYSTRSLLVVMTVVALILGLVGVAIRSFD